MKRLFFALLIALALPQFVFAAETVRKIDIQADLAQDRNLTVSENIDYDFGIADRHGIYRDIPTHYSRNAGSYNLRLNVLDVTRDGVREPYAVSSISGGMRIKIGDANKTITGLHSYRIRYQTDRAINSFDDHDELYWNAVGDGWPAPIERVNFRLVLPNQVDATEIKTSCFVGPYGSTETSCRGSSSANGADFTTARILDAHEGFTVVIGFPKGLVRTLTPADRVWQVLQDNGVLLFPLFSLVGMLFLWWMKGKDPQLGTVIPEYEAPSGYVPATLAAASTEGEVPDRAITATIIDLARRGYLKINFGEEKGLLFGSTPTYTFLKTNKSTSDLSDFEKDLYEGIFDGVDERTLKVLQDPSNKFYTDVQAFKRHVSALVDARNLFDKNPLSVRGKYIGFGFLIGMVMYFFVNTGLGIAAAIATGMIIAIIGWFMPRRNAQGTEFLRKAKGFEWFMSVTDKERLDFHNAPERTPTQFMSILPFAIAFGMEKKWAAQFAGLNIPPPDWAQGSGLSNFSTINFVSNLGSMHSAAVSSFSPPSSAGSGGSGFSGGGGGGGFGGGGGGSW